MDDIAKKWQAVLDALQALKEELEGQWPVPYGRPAPPMFMRGYSQDRHRRPLPVRDDA